MFNSLLLDNETPAPVRDPEPGGKKPPPVKEPPKPALHFTPEKVGLDTAAL